MSKPDEKGVREAVDNFQQYCLVQIVGAWFADAPDPQKLVDEMLGKWSKMMRERFGQAARARAEATGIVTAGGQWLEDVIEEAEKRIRRSLEKSIGDANTVLQPVCVRPEHNCQEDKAGCVFELARSKRVN